MMQAPPPIDGAIMADFHARFQRLGAHPDKGIIDDLVNFSKVNVSQGYHVAQAIVSRFMDRRVSAACKLPMLYVIDAIMKYVGGLYPHYFSRYVVDVAQRGFAELQPGREQDKLNFLLQTWLERNLLDASALAGIEALQKAYEHKKATAPPPQPAHTVQYQQPTVFQPYLHQKPVVAAHVEALMRTEMQQQLNEMLVGMGSTITLEELATANPEVYASIRQQAELNVHAKFPQLAPAHPQSYTQNITAPLVPPPPRAPSPVVVPTQPLDPYLSRWGRKHKGGVHDIEEEQSLGYIAETPVVVRVKPALELAARMDVDDDSIPENIQMNGVKRRALVQARSLARQRLSELMSAERPSLPDIVTGPLPLEPSKQYVLGLETYKSAARKVGNNASSSAFGLTRHKVPMPKFDVNALNRPKDFALQGLYMTRRHQYQEDAARFRSQKELDNYIDVSTIRKIKVKTLLSSGVLFSRQWYYQTHTWCEDFDDVVSTIDQSIEAGEAGSSHLAKEGSSNGVSAQNQTKLDDDGWQYTVPADEHFIRCPVSKNKFVQKWDDDEGEMLYMNAVKVFVTEAADSAIFNIGQPTEHEGTHYLIVDKTLVLDPWRENGKAASVQDAIERYQTMLASIDDNKEASYEDYIQSLKIVGAEEDCEHCFTMLELR